MATHIHVWQPTDGTRIPQAAATSADGKADDGPTIKLAGNKDKG